MDKSAPEQSRSPQSSGHEAPAQSAESSASPVSLRSASYDEGAQRLAPPQSWAEPVQMKGDPPPPAAPPEPRRRIHGSQRDEQVPTEGPQDQATGATATQDQAPAEPEQDQASGATATQDQAPAEPAQDTPPEIAQSPVPEQQGPTHVDVRDDADGAPIPEGQAAPANEGPGGGDGPANEAPGGGGPPDGPGPDTDNAPPGGPPEGPGPASDDAPGGEARFVAPPLGPAAIGTPESMERHHVERVIGPDPSNGNTFFWGRPAPAQVDEHGQTIQDSFTIPQGAIDAYGQERAAAANAALNEFLADGDARLERIRQEKTTAIEQVRTYVVNEKARALAGIATAKQTTVDAFANARQTIARNAATAKAVVQAAHVQINGQIATKLATALTAIDTKNTAALDQVTQLRTRFATSVNSAFDAGIGKVQGVGDDFAARALEQARGRADAFRNQALPETSAVGNFFNGRDFEANKRAARVDAATQVGAAYASEFRTKAGEVATGLQNGAQQVITGAGQTFTHANTSLGTAAGDGRKALNDAAAEARKSAQDFVTAKTNAIDTQAGQLERALTQAQGQATQQFATMETQTGQSIDTTGDTVVAMLETGYDNAVAGISQTLEEVRGLAQGAEPPDADELLEILSQKKAELDTAENTVRSTLTSQAEVGKGQIKSAADGAVNAATQLQGQMAAQIQVVVGQSNDALTTTRGEIEQAKTTVGGGFGTTADGIVQRHGETADAAINGLTSDTTNALANVNARLGQYETDLRTDFAQTIGGMNGKIASESTAAAAKVQPAWKRYLAVIIKVIVAIVVAVAIAALFASGVGIGVLLLGGLLIGAAGAVITYLAECALGLKQFEWKTLGVEALKGGIGGMIGVLTAGVGGAVMTHVAGLFTNAIAGTVVGFLAAVTTNFVINSVVTVVQQIVDNLANKPLREAFTGLGTAFVENAGVNLIGAFAGSLNAGSRPSGGANPFAGNVGLRQGMQNFGANMRTGFTAGTFNATDGVGLLSAGGIGMGAPIAFGSGAAMGAADPLNLNNQPHSQETRADESSKTRTRVATETRTALDRTEATARTNGRNTPAPSAAFQFDPVRR